MADFRDDHDDGESAADFATMYSDYKTDDHGTEYQSEYQTIRSGSHRTSEGQSTLYQSDFSGSRRGTDLSDGQTIYQTDYETVMSGSRRGTNVSRGQTEFETVMSESRRGTDVSRGQTEFETVMSESRRGTDVSRGQTEFETIMSESRRGSELTDVSRGQAEYETIMSESRRGTDVSHGQTQMSDSRRGTEVSDHRGSGAGSQHGATLKFNSKHSIKSSESKKSHTSRKSEKDPDSKSDFMSEAPSDYSKIDYISQAASERSSKSKTQADYVDDAHTEDDDLDNYRSDYMSEALSERMKSQSGSDYKSEALSKIVPSEHTYKSKDQTERSEFTSNFAPSRRLSDQPIGNDDSSGFTSENASATKLPETKTEQEDEDDDYDEMEYVGFNSGNGSLFIATSPMPTVQEGEVLMKIIAAGVNRLDINQVAGKSAPPAKSPRILGTEVSGILSQVSVEAARKANLKKGDRVMAMIEEGGYAEFVVLPYQLIMKIPKGINMIDAAGLPEAFLLAYQAIVMDGKLQDGETLVVHAGATDFGLAAIQLGRVIFRDVKIIATASSWDRLDICRDFGADLIVNHKTMDVAAKIKSATDRKGADVILDQVGALFWKKHPRCIAMDGRIIHTGFMGGSQVEDVNLALEFRKRAVHIFSSLKNRSLEYREKLISQFMRDCASSFESGALKVHVDKEYPLEQATMAHARLKQNKNAGKIILTL